MVSPPLFKMADKELINLATSVLPVRVNEKKNMGEVFTPPRLIGIMLDTLPTSAWKNPDAKWLDPSCGIGNFFIFVYIRLMDGLKNWKPNKRDRHRHIVEKMLYMVELNPENYRVCRSLFGDKANILCGNFLTIQLEQKFDYVVGNPPFQGGAMDKGRGIKLYNSIFLKANESLKRGGYVLFVVPDNMFSGISNSGYRELLLNYVKFVSFNRIENYFNGIQQEMCYFLMQKVDSNSRKTNIENQHGDIIQVKLCNRQLNPVRNWTLQTERLVNKYISKERNNSKYNRGEAISNYVGKKYTLIYAKNRKLYTNDKKLAVGLGVPKIVIFTISPNLDFEIDIKGEFGVGPNTIYIPYNRKIVSFLQSDEYKMLAYSTRTTRQFIKLSLIEYLNIPLISRNAQRKTRKASR